jgi:hypothetical protein
MVGCGSSGSPVAASPASPYPSVAGNYSGSVLFSYVSLGRSLTCPATTTVNQSGASVTFAPLILSGSCASLGSLPLGDQTVTTTGSLGSASQDNLFVASCNGYYNGFASGGFFGATFQFSLVYSVVSGGCVSQLGNFTVTGTLSR